MASGHHRLVIVVVAACPKTVSRTTLELLNEGKVMGVSRNYTTKSGNYICQNCNSVTVTAAVVLL